MGSASRVSDGCTSVPNILSLTRSPTSFINARPLSRSLNSSHVTVCSVEARSFLIYVFNRSESNLLGRGDVAPERGLAGDRMPDNVELAMMKRDGRMGLSVVEGIVVDCLCNPILALIVRLVPTKPLHVYHYFSWATFVITA